MGERLFPSPLIRQSMSGGGGGGGGGKRRSYQHPSVS